MKIVITPRGFANVGLEYVKIMEDKGFTVDYNNSGKTYTKEQFYEHCQDADGIIVGTETVDRAFVDHCKNVKAIVKFGVGIDNIDAEYCDSKGIFVGRCAGCNSRSVAELAITFILADTKNLIESINETRKGSWNKYTGSEVLGKTLGIIGFGAIGKHLAVMAKGLGMKVLAFDAFPIAAETASAYGVQISCPEEIYRTADFISVHVPLTEETRDMITLEEIRSMKKNCVLLNTARGGIVNEADLYEALTTHLIKAAYFDVFTREPPEAGERLLTLDNFFLTPHIASRSAEAELNTCSISTDIILRELGA